MFTESFSPRILTILEARRLRSRYRQRWFLLKRFFLFCRWLPSVSSLGLGIKAHPDDLILGFLGGSDSKESFYNAEDPGSTPELEDPLEKVMAIHSSIIAWKIPWTEEPDGLQSMRSQRVGHD